jgi:hypothetical protein
MIFTIGITLSTGIHQAVAISPTSTLNIVYVNATTGNDLYDGTSPVYLNIGYISGKVTKADGRTPISGAMVRVLQEVR